MTILNKPQLIINQHYVPRTYLKRFQTGDNKIWAYDHQHEMIGRKPNAIKSLCSSDHFYDLPATLDASNKELFQRIEQDLGRIETIGANFISATVKGLSKLIDTSFDPMSYARPPARLYKNLAAFASIQFLRTEAYRSSIRVLSYKWTEKEIRQYAKEKSCDSNFDWGVNENWIKFYHILEMSDFMKLAPVLHKRIWRFGIAPKDNVLWTSDNPVALLSQNPSAFRPDFYEPGLRIAFPLSPHVTLLLYDDEWYRNMDSLDGKPLMLTSSDVDELNQLQFEQSYRFVLSSLQFEQNRIDTCAGIRRERVAANPAEADFLKYLSDIRTQEARLQANNN